MSLFFGLGGYSNISKGHLIASKRATTVAIVEKVIEQSREEAKNFYPKIYKKKIKSANFTAAIGES